MHVVVNEKFIRAGLALSMGEGRMIIQNKGDQIVINLEHAAW